MLSETTKKFNEYLAQNLDLQVKLRAINSPFDLINIAKKEGFELTIEEFKELATIAYEQWLIKLTPKMRLFFEKIYVTPELNNELHHCNSVEDLINLAKECDFEITLSQLQEVAEIAQSIQGFSFEKIFFQNLGIIK